MSDDTVQPYDPGDVVLGEGDSVEVGQLDAPGRLGEQPFTLDVDPQWPGPVWWQVVHRADGNVFIDFRSNTPGVSDSVGLAVTDDTEPGTVAFWETQGPAGKITVTLAYELG